MNESFCQIYLTRHGETDWNQENRLQGHTDIPLNQKGKEQALLLNQKLKEIEFAAVFSSDLLRAKETAGIILHPRQLKICESSALREGSMGRWEGRLFHEFEEWAKTDLQTPCLSKEEFLSYGWAGEVESYAKVYERFKRFLDLHVYDYLGKAVLISSHGGVLRTILSHLDFRVGYKWKVSNCAFLKLLLNRQGELFLDSYEGIHLGAQDQKLF